MNESWLEKPGGRWRDGRSFARVVRSGSREWSPYWFLIGIWSHKSPRLMPNLAAGDGNVAASERLLRRQTLWSRNVYYDVSRCVYFQDKELNYSLHLFLLNICHILFPLDAFFAVYIVFSFTLIWYKSSVREVCISLINIYQLFDITEYIVVFLFFVGCGGGSQGGTGQWGSIQVSHSRRVLPWLRCTEDRVYKP